jgi:hypothetical protein
MCLSALADLVVKNQIITVNSNQFGALHFINAPYKIGDRTEAVWAITAKESPIKTDVILTIVIVFLVYFSGD